LRRQPFLSGAILLSKPGIDKRKTVLRTVRISESLAGSLKNEAADEGTTVNADINSILSQHFEWNKKAREFGIGAVPKSLIMSLIEAVDDETLARVGREVLFPTWKEMAEYWIQDSSPNGLLNFMSFRSKFSPSNLIKITREEDTYTVVSRHDFGPRWSIIIKSAIQELVKQSFHVEPRISMGESVVTTRFKVNPRKSPT
jgi:hypothetical protein